MLSNVSLTIAGTRVGADERGLAAGLLNTSIQLGNAWGLAVVATLIAAARGGTPDADALVSGLRIGLVGCAGFGLAALAAVLLGSPRTPNPTIAAAAAADVSGLRP